MGPPRKKQRLSLDGAAGKKAPVAGTETKAAPPAAAPPADATATSPTAAVDGDAAAPKRNVEDEKESAAQRRSLFVRALAPTTTTESLTALFSDKFPLKHAAAVMDRETKLCKGYGFVTFADAEDCRRAKEEFNGVVVEGRKLRCEIAEPRQRDGETGAAGPTAGQKAKEAREKEKAERMQPPRLIVRNLPWSIKYPDQLAKLFQSYGKVKHAVLPKKKDGLLMGFGFVILRGRPNAEKALEGVNGKEIDGRTLAVDWAVDKDTWTNIKEEKTEAPEKDAEDDDVEDNEHIMKEDDAVDEEGSDEEDDDVDITMGDDGDDEDEEHPDRPDEGTTTLFIRNLPFTCTDEDLEDHFSQFGATRYARIVVDQGTDRPKGTGFVCFYNPEDAEKCLRGAPRHQPPPSAASKGKDPAALGVVKSILQDEDADPTGQYTLDGRVLQVSRAVNKNEASRLTEEGVASRFKRDTDKRRLYLLSEGTIPSNSPLYEKLSPSERTMREASAKQRKTLIESNPSLHMSLTRLSVRNIPRSITSKDLKQLAREAVVGFAIDVKDGKRQRMSKEELSRGGEEMVKAEADRRARSRGIVKQATIVFEGREGGKVDEKSGAGRSRGYGFIEYYTHRSALMGLRWLNGHAVGAKALAAETEKKGKKASAAADREAIEDRKKRLIVEFAIENAQVVKRRKEIEEAARARKTAIDAKKAAGGVDGEKSSVGFKGKLDRKRKRDGKDDAAAAGAEDEKNAKLPADEKLAKRQQIIQKKRMQRRAKKKGGA